MGTLSLTSSSHCIFLNIKTLFINKFESDDTLQKSSV